MAKDTPDASDRIMDAVRDGHGGPFTKDQQKLVDQLREANQPDTQRDA